MRSARPSIEPRLNKSHLAVGFYGDWIPFFVCIVLHFQEHLIIYRFPFHINWRLSLLLFNRHLVVFAVFTKYSEILA